MEYNLHRNRESRVTVLLATIKHPDRSNLLTEGRVYSGSHFRGWSNYSQGVVHTTTLNKLGGKVPSSWRWLEGG